MKRFPMAGPMKQARAPHSMRVARDPRPTAADEEIQVRALIRLQDVLDIEPLPTAFW